MRTNNAEQYLIEVIKDWLKQFEGISVKFIYEESSDYYIIVVTPESIFNDESFRKAVLKVWSEFMQNFVESDLLISEPDESYNTSNVLFDSITSL